MRTRNANTPKTPTSQKKTPPSSKKSAAKTPQTPVESTPESSVTPGPTPSTDPKPEPAVQQAKASSEDVATPTSKGTTTKKVTKRIVKKKVMKPKTPASAKDGTAPTAKAGETNEVKADVAPKDEEISGTKDVEPLKTEEVVKKDAESVKQKEPTTEKGEEVIEPQDKEKEKMDVDESPVVEAVPTEKTESVALVGVENVAGSDEPTEVRDEDNDEDPEEEVDDAEKLEPEKEKVEPEKEKLESENENKGSQKEVQDKTEIMDEDQKKESVADYETPENKNDDKMEEQAAQTKGDEGPGEGIEEYGDEEGFVEPGDEDLQEDDEPETGDEMKAWEEENKELAAAAKERKVKKELEIFVGGLDREVVEEDVRKAFEKVGDVLEVRLLKDPSTNKNRGFAFVRFSTKDQAKRALSEMKNPVIRGKRCGTAPNEDNDTLFLGNVCNTWTKEAVRLILLWIYIGVVMSSCDFSSVLPQIKQKLKEYSVEGVENITLVQDPRHEGLSRGFCFIQFSCHADAMFAYKRLQKPDAIFGHIERTAKVAFAEPLQEPDPEVMAKVKSVFVDGLPPHWDEDRVRKHFKVYGEIERITLARNMSSAKRKDFGFVDFTTHEAAIGCIEDVNSKELSDGNSKTKVRARLSNPLPKTQAVKGGMCGGLRIGRPSGRSFSRTGPPPNRPNFHYGRPSRGHFNDPVGPYGRRMPYRGGHGAPGVGAAGRPNFGGPRDVGRGFGRAVPPRREPFPLDDGGYSRPFMGRQYDDPYVYDDNHGLKRPFYMTDQDPTYMEPSRVRPRFDYSGSGRGVHFRDTYGAGSGFYSSGYYGPDYGARPHSSFNNRDRPYGGGRGFGNFCIVDLRLAFGEQLFLFSDFTG
ncbi:Heterogeneous nuclear ribonucleoprotein Q [Bienertia sinuspersici]